MIWLHFQDCTGCTETLLRSSLGAPDSQRYLARIPRDAMAGSGRQAEESLRAAVENYSGKYVCVVEGSIPTRENGIYMKLAGRPAVEVLEDDRTLEVLRVILFRCECGARRNRI